MNPASNTMYKLNGYLQKADHQQNNDTIHQENAANIRRGSTSYSNQYKAILHKIWNDWKNAKNAAPGEEREIAVHRMTECIERNSNKLDLSFLCLSSLPTLLPSCQELSLYKNQLSRIPANLPDTLSSLDISRNPLMELPTSYPKSLKILKIIDCQVKIDLDSQPRNLNIISS